MPEKHFVTESRKMYPAIFKSFNRKMMFTLSFLGFMKFFHSWAPAPPLLPELEPGTIKVL
jgi:hypothetical protein